MYYVKDIEIYKTIIFAAQVFHIDYEIYRFHKDNAIQWLTVASLVINFNDVLFLPGLYLHLFVGIRQTELRQ